MSSKDGYIYFELFLFGVLGSQSDFKILNLFFFDFLLLFFFFILFAVVSDGMFFAVDWSSVGDDKFLILLSREMDESTNRCGLIDNSNGNDRLFN